MLSSLKKRPLKHSKRDEASAVPNREVSGMWELTKTSSKAEGLVEFVSYQDGRKPASLTAYSVVAVHGLKGDPFASWTAFNGPELWLRDFLPKQVPVRVLTFGYNSHVEWSRSVADIEDHALSLLNWMDLKRQTEQEEVRPMVLIGHSLGGVIIKRALILAHERPGLWSSISKNVRGVAFLGVPHRGSQFAQWGSLFASLLKSTSLKFSTNDAVVVDLRQSSEALKILSFDFIEPGKDLIILSFYEALPMQGFRDPIVDEHSALLGFSNETTIKVNANHEGISKFESAESDTYKLVGGAVVQMINRILQTQHQVSFRSRKPKLPA